MDAPSAAERAALEAELPPEELLAAFRQRLEQGGPAPALIRALNFVGRRKSTDDLPLIVKYVGHIDPAVAAAAMDALRQQGSAALEALRALDDTQVDRESRKQAVEQLLRDHIFRCGRRDMAINPFRLQYKDRFAELYSVQEPLDELMLKMLRDARGEIRDDIAGMRYWYGAQQSATRAVLDNCGLAVAALAHSMPERLLREFADIATVGSDEYYYYYYGQRSAVTMELAIAFARNGNTALYDQFVTELEGSLRWGNTDHIARQHIQIASLQVAALDEHAQALARIDEQIRHLGADGVSTSQAHFLRARILVKLGEHGAALRALEDSMEASDFAMLMTLVDDTFTPLTGERRFTSIKRYCELAARRVDASRRPWRAQDKAPE